MQHNIDSISTIDRLGLGKLLAELNVNYVGDKYWRTAHPQGFCKGNICPTW